MYNTTKKKNKLTREDWEKMGALMKFSYDMNLSLISEIGEKFGKSTKIYAKLKKIYDLSMDVKSMLDEEVCVTDTESGCKLFGDDATEIFYSKWYGNQKETAKEYVEDIINTH